MNPVIFAVVVATLTAPNSIFPRGPMTSMLEMLSESCRMLAKIREKDPVLSSFSSEVHVARHSAESERPSKYDDSVSCEAIGDILVLVFSLALAVTSIMMLAMKNKPLPRSDSCFK